VDRGRQRESSKFNRQPPSSVSTQVYYRRKSFRDRVIPSEVGEVSAYSPPDALLAVTSSSLCPEADTSFNAAVFEASISRQVSSNLYASRENAGVSHVGYKENSVGFSTFFGLS